MTFSRPTRGSFVIPLALLLTWVILIGFQGCVTPITAPQTPIQQVALARVSLAAVYNTATSLSQANRLSIDQLRGIQSRGRQVEDALSTAEIALSINKNDAAGLEALRVAQRILRELDSTVTEVSR